MTHAAFVHCQHMDGRTEVEVDPSTSVALHDLARHAGPAHGTTTHGIRWRNLDDGMDRIGSATMIKWVRLVAIDKRFNSESCAWLECRRPDRLPISAQLTVRCI